MIDLHNPIYDILGMPGRMLSGSKQTPPRLKDHTIYWNACVFLKHGKLVEQIWHGDLDVTARMDDFKRLAKELGGTIYVTPEQPWRFDGFKQTAKLKHHAERMLEFKP